MTFPMSAITIKDRVMKKSIFEHELSKAQTLYEYGKDEEKEFWRGYMRGVRRRYHGENFETEADHQKWLSLVNDDYHHEAGRGYRAGFYGPVRLVTNHPKASYGIPIFWDKDGEPMDYAEGFTALRDWWGIDNMAEEAWVSVRTAEGWCAGRMPGSKNLLRLFNVMSYTDKPRDNSETSS